MMRKYPLAKKRLIVDGFDPARVDAMPVARVVLLQSFMEYEQQMQRRYRWVNFPYAQAIERLNDENKTDSGVAETLPLQQLFGADVRSIIKAKAITQLYIELLRTVEAIRLHAAVHDGKLPGSLAEITIVPVPNDPMTGQPFSYQLSGDTAVIAPAAMDWKPNHFEITIAREGRRPMTHILKTLLLVVVAGLLPTTRPIDAADVSTLLPFVDEQTAIVLRIEPSQLPPAFRERLGWASGFLPATVSGQLRRVIQNPRITQAFVVASLRDSPDEIPFVVFDRPDDWTESDSKAMVDQTNFEAASIGDAVIVALPRVVERLREGSPNPTRNVVREAFAQSSPGSMQLAITLNDDHRRVVEQMWQPLLDRRFPIDAKVLARHRVGGCHGQ